MVLKNHEDWAIGRVKTQRGEAIEAGVTGTVKGYGAKYHQWTEFLVHVEDLMELEEMRSKRDIEEQIEADLAMEVDITKAAIQELEAL